MGIMVIRMATAVITAVTGMTPLPAMAMTDRGAMKTTMVMDTAHRAPTWMGTMNAMGGGIIQADSAAPGSASA